ncbi:MAG: hypothetical protein WBD31_15315 [Rubripirellula sp.]
MSEPLSGVVDLGVVDSGFVDSGFIAPTLREAFSLGGLVQNDLQQCERIVGILADSLVL